MINENDFLSVNKLDKCFIPHKAMQDAIDEINKCILLSSNAVEPRCMVLTGEAGTGKTSICNLVVQQFKISFEKRKGREVTIVPIFYCLIPNPVTIKSVASALLAALGDPTPTRGTTIEMTFRLGVLLKQCETKIILLDELQHLFIKDEISKKNDEVKDWLKTIINEFKVPLVIVGMPTCEQIIDTSSQLARRFTHRHRLTNLSLGGENDGEFRSFIVDLADFCYKKINIDSLPDFKSETMSLALHIATGGNPADSKTLLKNSIWNAFEDNRRSVNKNDFKIAFDKLLLPNSLSKENNPFELSINELVSLQSNS